MTRPWARSGAVRRTIALCIVPKPESVAPMASWSARERAYHGDPAKASSSSAPARELPAKSRRMARRAAPGADHRRGDEGAEPLRGDEEPERDRSHVEDVAGEDRQHLLVGEHERVHEDGDREHAEDGRVRCGPHGARRGGCPGPARTPGVPGSATRRAEAAGGDEGAEREDGEREVARGGSQPGEEEAAQERADHLGGLHRHGLERDRGGQALAARDDEQHGAARREVEHPGHAEDDLDRDQGAEPGEARGEEEREGQRGRDVQRPAPRIMTRTRGSRSARTPAKGPRAIMGAARQNAATPTMQRRVGEGERQPAEHDQVHPARGAGAEPGQPEEPVALVAERLEHGAVSLSGASRGRDRGWRRRARRGSSRGAPHRVERRAAGGSGRPRREPRRERAVHERDQRDDVEHREAGRALDVRRIGRHVRALEDEGAEVRVVRQRAAAPPGRAPRGPGPRRARASSPSSTRVNSFSPSRPATARGMSGPMPAPRRCSSPSAAAFTVRMPTRRPGGSIRWTRGTSRRLEVSTGTRTDAASSAWYFTRKPQLVVTAPTPSRSSWRAPSTKAGEEARPRPAGRRGRGRRRARGGSGRGTGTCAAWPMSPGMRGKRVSSIRMPTVNPYWLKPPRTRPVVVIDGARILRLPLFASQSGLRGETDAARSGCESDRQAPAVRPEGLPVERLVEPGRASPRRSPTWR